LLSNDPQNPFTQADAEALLRRSDYFVDRARHIMVVGSGSHTQNFVAPIFGSGYNSIAVATNVGGGTGFTTLAGSGRVKPDIVAPFNTVSAATPVVASAAAVLIETGTTPFADRPQTIKAILMTGATKSAFDSAAGGPWSNSSSVPLDSRFGAGMVNINNSHLIMTAGRQLPSNTVTIPKTGWDFNNINSTTGPSSRSYFFDVLATDQPMLSFSATLTWHREFQVGDVDNFTLAQLSLRLFQSDSNFQLGSLIMESVSQVDNVQHLWRTTALPAGRYAIIIDSSGVTNTDYGVAWQIIATPEPSLIFVSIVVVLAAGYRIRVRKIAMLS
jgi:hypothetical protein